MRTMRINKTLPKQCAEYLISFLPHQKCFESQRFPLPSRVPKYQCMKKITKKEKEKIALLVFKMLIPNWQGTKMCFPLLMYPMVTIEGKDIMKLIIKSIK